LWPCGDAVALDAALQATATTLGSAARARVRAHFDEQLSQCALGLKLTAAYRELLNGHARAVGAVPA